MTIAVFLHERVEAATTIQTIFKVKNQVHLIILLNAIGDHRILK
jgi:hypothetical protein